MTAGELRYLVHVPVRFRDLDLGGHVHHSEAVMYFEEARAAYWRDVAGRPGLDDIDYVVAEAEIRYHARIGYPEELAVRTGVVRLGRKHFEMRYEIRSSAGPHLVSGRTVQVMFDYARGRSVRMPDELIERIRGFEGPGLDGPSARVEA